MNQSESKECEHSIISGKGCQRCIQLKAQVKTLERQYDEVLVQRDCANADRQLLIDELNELRETLLALSEGKK